MVKSFCAYQEINVPEELTDIVAKTEKFLEEKKALERDEIENADKQHEKNADIENRVSLTEGDSNNTSELEETDTELDDRDSERGIGTEVENPDNGETASEGDVFTEAREQVPDEAVGY